ncbi:hypothetical protein L484_009574 [Morus notabilis]|uniref:Uncharacterized protein n=1 Tax=Morus notabilis TaxID=981085 RepID=W9QBR9_9ROSA|nr:hypothetical protein L484_009574 [Morus notabilis]
MEIVKESNCKAGNWMRKVIDSRPKSEKEERDGNMWGGGRELFHVPSPPLKVKIFPSSFKERRSRDPGFSIARAFSTSVLFLI